MAVMWFAPAAPTALSRPAQVVRPDDTRRPLAPLTHARSRAPGRGRPAAGVWRWAQHALVAALVVSPLVASWAWGVPLLTPPLLVMEARGPAADYVDYWSGFRRDWLPALGPLAEDDRPLVERVTSYRVAPGETLGGVAQRFGISPDTLVWANALADPDHLLADQELTVLPVSGVLHTVVEGETVGLLAERYGANPMTLVAANGLPEPFALSVGDRLLIPDGRPLRARSVPWPAPGTGIHNRQQYIEAAAAAAQETQRRWGVPASVAIAQAIHETGWGGSLLARDGHNYFGIKGRNSPGPAGVVWFNTWEVFNGRNVIVREPFRAYNNPEESFLDYGLFFHQNRRYHAALAVAHDARAFTHAMAAAGFATDPVYASKIIRTMDLYNLYQYDLR